MVQGDELHIAHDAVGLNEVPDGKGVGGEDHEPPGHVGQNVLRRQGDAQGGNGQQRHQRGHVHAQALGGDDHGDDVQHHLGAGEDVPPDPAVQLGFAQDALQYAQQDPDHQDADEKGDDGGEDVSQGEAPDGLVEDVGHRNYAPSLSILLPLAGKCDELRLTSAPPGSGAAPL